MAKIVFCMYHGIGHFNPTFAVAKQLKSVGHQVRYLGVADFAEHVEAQGFEYITVMEAIYPKGTFLKEAPAPSFSARKIINMIISSRGLHGFLVTLADLQRQGAKQILAPHKVADLLIEEGELDVAMQAVQADLLVIDHMHSILALIAYKNKIPFVLLKTSFPECKEPGVPPASTTIIPDNSKFSHMVVALAWYKTLLGKFFRQYLHPQALYLLLTVGPSSYDKKMKKFAIVECNYPLELIDETGPYIEFNMPEMIMCPQSLDFRRPEKKHRRYIEACIDLERIEVSFPWEKLNSSKPLIFCSLGTRNYGNTAERLLQTIINVMATKPEMQAVISIGSELRIEDFHSVPANVLLVNKAPQLEMLKRARMMITHGGLGTIKECIWHGVPMIVFPFESEQPGNAARVAHHGLGLIGNPQRVSVNQIHTLIEVINKDGSFKTRVELMRKIFVDMEKNKMCFKVIDSALQNSSSNSK